MNKFIDIESSFKEIISRVGITVVTSELECQAKLASSWNDDIGNKVKEVLSSFVKDFSSSYSELELEIKKTLNEKENDLVKLDSYTESILNKYVERMKNYDVDPSLYR